MSSIQLNEIVEVAPKPPYRQWATTGTSLGITMSSEGGLECLLTGKHHQQARIYLDASQRKELTEWLNAIP